MRKSAVQGKCLCRGLDETSEWESDEAVNLNDLVCADRQRVGETRGHKSQQRLQDFCVLHYYIWFISLRKKEKKNFKL